MARERFAFNASVFAVLRRGPEVLTLRRSGTGWLDGHWSRPAGAYEGNETFSDAARRELHEETGLLADLTSCGLAHVQQVFMRQAEWLAIYVEIGVFDGTPRLAEPDKHDRLEWRDLTSGQEQVVPYVEAALREIAGGQTSSVFRTQAF